MAAINAADTFKVRAPVSLNPNSQLGTQTNYSATAVGEALAMGAGVTTLYGVLVLSGTLTNNFAASGDVQACVKVLQDP